MVEVDVGGGNVVESVACEELGVCSTRHVLSAAAACTDVRSIQRFPMNEGGGAPQPVLSGVVDGKK
jgi:hypothetical protein